MSTETQTLVGKFVWHDHMSGDVEKAKSFYTDLLGWDVETVDVGDEKYPMIKNDGGMHGGFGASQGGAPPHWLGHVRVDNVDETIEKAKKARSDANLDELRARLSEMEKAAGIIGTAMLRP